MTHPCNNCTLCTFKNKIKEKMFYIILKILVVFNNEESNIKIHKIITELEHTLFSNLSLEGDKC